MTMLGVHIFHYYSSNSITSNYTVFTGVITSVCRQTNTCACLVTLAIDVVETIRTANVLVLLTNKHTVVHTLFKLFINCVPVKYGSALVAVLKDFCTYCITAL